MSYEWSQFPAYATSASGEQRLVESADALQSLGDGWSVPGKPDVVPPQDLPGFQEYPKWVNGEIAADADAEAAIWARDGSRQREQLLQLAADKGVKVDKRWSDEKILAAIEAA